MERIFVNVTGIWEQYRPKCRKSCAAWADCSLMKLYNRLKSDCGMRLIQLSIDNGGRESLSMDAEGWELIDAAGYAVGGAAVCESLLPADHVPLDQWSISPQTRIRTMLVFPATSAPPGALRYEDEQFRLEIPLKQNEVWNVRAILRENHAKRLKKRVRMRITEQWMIRDAQGKKQYICIGRKK